MSNFNVGILNCLSILSFCFSFDVTKGTIKHSVYIEDASSDKKAYITKPNDLSDKKSCYGKCSSKQASPNPTRVSLSLEGKRPSNPTTGKRSNIIMTTQVPISEKADQILNSMKKEESSS